MKFGTIVASQARRVPQRVAVACGTDHVTFAQLHARSDRLANALLARGLRGGDRVVLYLGNGLPFVELFLANAAAGEIRVADLVAAGDAAPPPAFPAAADDAMIMYTSGTTGVPKGAIITHSNLITQTYMNGAEWKLTDDDRFLATTPLAHRIGLARVTCGLLLGATSVVMPRFDAADAARLIDAEGVTVMGMVPTVARMLLDHLEGVAGGGESLRVVLVTGEAFPVEVKRRLQARSIVDRKKDMILSGGLNIYSKEVERALESHPAVAEAAVIGVLDRHFGEAVCAYVILEPGASATADELIAHCRTLIASYKKPRDVRFVETLPRNSVGKVVKASLRANA